jgi:PAS domain S-box-containing protein
MAGTDTDLKIMALQARLDELQRLVAEQPGQLRNVVLDTFEELQSSLEELQVLDEELRVQNEDLAAARLDSEREARRYGELFNFAPDGYLVTDSRGVIQEANRAAAVLLSADQQRLVGLPLSAFVASRDIKAFMNGLTRLLRTREIYEWELAFEPQGGRPFPAAVSVAMAVDERRGLTTLRWLIRDVTERKRAEEQVESLARFPGENPSPIMRLSREGAILYANAASLPLLAMWGREVGQAVPEDWRERVARATESQSNEQAEITCADRIFAITFAPIAKGGYVNVYALDITERRRAESELAHSHSMLQAALESTADGLLITDREGHITGWNRRFQEMWGIPDSIMEPRERDRVRAFTWGQIKEPARVEDRIRELYASPGAEGYDELELKDGRVFERYSMPQMLGGEPVGRVWSYRDVTQQRRAGEKLRVERLRLLSVLDLFPGFVYLRAPDHGIRFANRAFREIYGDPEGRPCYGVLHGRSEPCKVCQPAEVFETQQPRVWEVALLNKRTYLAHATPFEDVDGSRLALIIGIDISERKQAEELQQECIRSEERAVAEERRANWMATVLDQMPVGVAIARAPDVKLVMANKAAEELWGSRTAGVKHGGFSRRWRYFWPDGRPVKDAEYAISRAVKKGEQVRGEEHVMERPDGERRDLLVNAAPLFEDGKVVGGVSVFWDVTTEREARRRLEEASKMKDEFLSLASHELKTPVTSIKLYAELITRRPEAMQPKLLDTLTRQADQLVGLVNDLLDVSRLELGRSPLETRRMDLADLARELCESRRPLFHDRVLACPHAQPTIVVDGDPLRLDQVISNLLDNALKYSSAGSPVWVRVGARDGRALIEVEDRGMGISREHLPHVFERFYKPGPQQSVYSGLGVGLYICRRIVEGHGGLIWAESEEGKGSTFYVDLPLAVAG